MNTDNLFNYPPLSFVLLRGFGEKSIPVQVGLDNRYLVLSTFYTLSGVLALPALVESFLGTQADLIKISKQNYINLLLKIKSIEESAECEKDEVVERIKSNDPLLVVRAFHQLILRHNLKNDSSIEISDEDLGLAIKHAVEEDDLIKNAHQNIVNTLKSLSS